MTSQSNKISSNGLESKASELVKVAEQVWNGSTTPMRVSIEPSNRLIAGMHKEGMESLELVYITDSDIRHIKRGHSRNEELRGQISLTPDDFAALSTVINEFDSCKYTGMDKLGNRKYLLTKLVGDIYYVATVQRGRRKLQVKTMWKKRRPGASC